MSIDHKFDVSKRNFVHEIDSLPVQASIASAKGVPIGINVLQTVVKSKLDELPFSGCLHHLRPGERSVEPLPVGRVFGFPNVSVDFFDYWR